ncbi:putative bifunctional diguanylate cyclase/phosphodiesterase [Cognatiyoonia sp. IB215182]|uniref:putative bifunctional diguanylate cyclase/phosphodiesterase n=1 Tax=Cognatiyoonia sp. IB215182 TaxID=3097353 RepID=UPI002A180F4D|nr:EAL domain-containing protein [Cognatiyoonia sp. IB215182]MDX8354445.1 EAL domain-containing protein [Cognatiyoonia sp. IB215182]
MTNSWTKLRRRVSATWVIHIGFFVSAIIAWPIMAEMELFERFYDYSRAHEDWDLDEFALLVVNLTIALLLSSIFQSTRLRKLVRQRDFERDRAEKNARHDPLTGLMNRRAFGTVLEQTADTVRANAPRYIAMLDLDRFKPVNDIHGHAAGDAAIRKVAQRLKAEVGEFAQVGRLGGDEFAIIFDVGTDVQQVERCARRLIHEVEKPVRFHGTPLHVSCSIGLMQWSEEISTTEALRRADKSLYAAKDGGRARFAWYDAELDQKSHERAQLEVDLTKAIADRAIEAWFQPVVNIETQGLIGFEVLARWTHPTRGAIAPSVFIEIAEDSGQIGNLGLSILRQACEAAASWDPKLTIAFNVSPLQFHDALLVEQIKQVLDDCGFDAKRLTIEVTESSIIHDFGIARAKLDALKELGVAVALDDFGTGYSSLASLRQLPFDRIKIDRSFVTNIAAEPQNQKIVAGIMALAKGLDLDVTAEGIETKDDLSYLQDLSCSLGQGFLFERAVPEKHVPWLMESQLKEWPLNAQEAGDFQKKSLKTAS